ncbi:MAG: amidohydrolase family protein [Candidatus Pacebacteria bacterium]|nr:amidohydrolase family protein [Candidatus Paceibacterota bacterium]
MLSVEGIIANIGEKKRIEIDTQTGLISNITEPSGIADVVLKDEIIFPGFIDLHVHAREDASHKQDYKEDFVTAGEAAINGGVVAIGEMPNNPVPPVDDDSFEKKNNLAKKSSITVVLYAGIGPNTKPLSLGHSHTGEAKKVPYKAFMGPSVGDLFFTSNEELEKALEKYENQCVSFHCEDPKILEENANKNTHEAKRPPEAEISAVDFALKLIEKYNLVGKICHCSTVLGINKIIDAKKRGINVTVEVTPHHLYFSADAKALADRDETNMLQVNPPIRQSKENRLGLIAFLKNGDIDYLATDHAPHTIEEKGKGISGLTHLDTYGPFTAWLMQEHNFTAKEIERVCSYNPANFINNFISDKYGKIEKGYVGSLTILNLNKQITITKDKLKTKCGWSPFEGITFPGSVAMTIIKGKIYAK